MDAPVFPRLMLHNMPFFNFNFFNGLMCDITSRKEQKNVTNFSDVYGKSTRGVFTSKALIKVQVSLPIP